MKVRFILFILSLSPGALAQDASASPMHGLVFAKVMLVLAGIVALILVCAWMAKRSGFAGFVNHNNFRVVASLPLGHKEKAVLIRAGSEHLLLGVTPANITLLQSYTEGENPLLHIGKDKPASNTRPPMDFATQIKKLISQGQKQ